MANTQDFTVVSGKSSLRPTACSNDPFTIQDGHYVGDDGFVVPSSFAEFYHRYPKYVANWVRGRTRGRATETEAEDWTQDLLLFLAALPLDSVFRRNGKQDVIQTFAPEKMHGANEARFLSFVGRCLSNKFGNLYAKWRKRPLSNWTNVSLDVDAEKGATDEYCHAASSSLRERERLIRERDEQRLRLKDFMNHADSSIAGLRQFLEVFMETGSWDETASRLNSTESASMRKRIHQFR